MKKKLTILFLQISLVWMGVSVLVDSANATRKDAARALELLRQARAAIGGENVVKNVQNLSIKGKSRRVVRIKNQTDKELNGDFEMAVLLPDQIFRMEKFGDGNVPQGAIMFEKEVAEIDNEMIIELREGEGEFNEEESMTAAEQNAHNEMLRFTLGFLLTPPKDANVTYDYTGEENLDGRTTNVIAVSSSGKSILRLYMDKQSNLPVMMSYKGFAAPPMPMMGEWIDKEQGRIPVDGKGVIIVRENTKLSEKMVFEQRIEKDKAPANSKKFDVFIAAPTEAEIQIKFGDYRVVGGIKLPHLLTEIVNGTVDQTMTVEAYEINVPNMAEKFKQDQIKVRVKKPE
jgi:hypothetical protein